MYISPTEVRCTVPERTLGTVYLTVSSTGLSMGQNQGRHFEYVAGGRILQLSPSAGPLAGGTTVTLQGMHLTALSEDVMCRFAGGVPAAPVKVSDIEVECASPQNAEEEMVEVSLVWNAVSMQASNTVQYFFHSLVSVAKLVPVRGPTAGESLVSVLGAGFRQQGLSVRMGASVVSRSDVMWVSSSLVLLTAPARLVPEKVDVEISINDGADFSSVGKQYLYEAGATVEALLPSRGMSETAGQVVTVVGQHFTESGELSCRFGDSLGVDRKSVV